MGEKPIKVIPKAGKNWPQEHTEGQFPKKDSANQKDRIGHPQITAAQPEAQIGPTVQQGDQEEKISQPSGTEKPKKAVKKPKPTTQQQPLPQMEKAVHPSRRCQKPAGRGSSYIRELT